MKTLALTLALLVLSACGGPQWFEYKGYGVSGKDPIHFTVESELLREWGGPGTPKFNQALQEELERLKMCRDGYTLGNEELVFGLYMVTVRCRS